MGWLFKNGYTRKDLIEERTRSWERTTDMMTVTTKCLAYCYSGGAFSGVVWSVWQRTFERREGVKAHHARAAEKRRKKTPAQGQ